MYVTAPKSHDGVMKYISYTLMGTDVQNQPSRRYSDFFALRERLLERWPGVYIPNIPPKKTIGNTDKKYINKRMRLLNKFCLKLSKFPFLYSSDEVILFQSYGSEVAKALAKASKIRIPEMLEQYKSAFSNYDENYDIILGKSKMQEHLAFLKKTLKNLQTFHNVVLSSVDKRDKEIAQYLEMMRQMVEYEKFVLMEYTDNNEGKLILFNPQNTLINEKLVELENNLNNPYIALDEYLEEAELDTEAAIEAFNSLTKLGQTVEKLNQKIDSIESELKQLQYGKQGLVSGLFKKKEQRTAELEKEKTQTHDDLECLALINKMAHFNMENFFNNFQIEQTKCYYKAVKIYALLQRDNNLHNEELWKEIKGCVRKVKG
ncbi:MAG: hypothetical protein MJ252_12660 [archaeon]|nr:hypothetical protein [archaeon]